jgi:hypothetical protein
LPNSPEGKARMASLSPNSSARETIVWRDS